MLNYLWSSMIIIGIVVAIFTGTLGEMTNALLDSASEAIVVVITMLGILCFWTGIMKIAEHSGLIESLTKKMDPILTFLFPRLDRGGKAREYIATNLLANVLGLGWAATPAGLKAMEELSKINRHSHVASKEMCMFLIVNMSSLQIVTVSVIAYRAQYGSASPSEIIGPGLAATLISTIMAVFFTKILETFTKN